MKVCFRASQNKAIKCVIELFVVCTRAIQKVRNVLELEMTNGYKFYLRLMSTLEVNKHL